MIFFFPLFLVETSLPSRCEIPSFGSLTVLQDTGLAVALDIQMPSKIVEIKSPSHGIQTQITEKTGMAKIRDNQVSLSSSSVFNLVCSLRQKFTFDGNNFFLGLRVLTLN